MTNPRAVVAAIEAEYRRYEKLAEDAMAQLDEPALSRADAAGSNSIAVIVWHVSGNLASRFTDFLTTDGEKPWRHRDEEFVDRTVTRDEITAKWKHGWAILFDTLAGLTDAHLNHTVTIRGQALTVIEALVRSLAHTSSHAGQIVYLAKAMRGDQWRNQSIPKAHGSRPTA